MFKVGDKVRYIGPKDYFGIKYGDIVLLTGHNGAHFYTTTVGPYKKIFFDLDRLEAVVTTTPHKHAELIKAWADGAEIQVRCLTNYGNPNDAPWEDFSSLDSTEWDPEWVYRIKPEPKPDSIRFGGLVDASEFMTVVWHTSKQSSDNVKAIFDGETGNLKAIELLK